MDNVSWFPPHIDIPLYGVYQYETGDSKETMSLWQGVRVTPYSVGRCHEVTEGTGDRWERRPPNTVVNQAQR